MDAENAKREAAPSDVPVAATRVSRQALDPATQALFVRALVALEKDAAIEAAALLRQATEQAPHHAQIRSALGVAIARAEGNFTEARNLCEEAAKQEFFSPVLYLNLAKVYLRFGRRAEALRYLRRGQMIDPGHEPINELIASLGRRRLPIVPFLPRRHPVNRALGNARTKVASTLFGG